jgi:hypothetical protein
MNQAKKARDNALQLEVKKDGLQQRQNGDWVLRFTAQNIDMHQVIVNAPMGTRFWCSLIELNDDETPVDHKAMERDKQRNKWRDMAPSQQAAMRCQEKTFWAHLNESDEIYWSVPEAVLILSEEQAARVVREVCDVKSRSDLDKPGFDKQRAAWRRMDDAYQAWKVKEGA